MKQLLRLFVDFKPVEYDEKNKVLIIENLLNGKRTKQKVLDWWKKGKDTIFELQYLSLV